MTNPFAALDDAETAGRGARGVDDVVDRSARGGARVRRRNRSGSGAARAREVEVEALRAAAHEAVEARLAREEGGDGDWGRVGRGRGIAKGAARRMAKEMTAAERGRGTETRAGGERADEGGGGMAVEADVGASVVATRRTPGVGDGAFEPTVSAVFAHAFPGASAKCWAVEIADEEGQTTTLSVTKAAPRVRKIPVNGKEVPVLIKEEIRAAIREWDELTRIDRARRAKAKRKAIEAERKAEKSAEDASVSAAEAVLFDGLPDDILGTQGRTSTPPPGFDTVRPRTPPGFCEPSYRVVHVPVIDPAMEARQRALEAQVAELQAQLAASRVTGAPPGFASNSRQSGSGSIW